MGALRQLIGSLGASPLDALRAMDPEQRRVVVRRLTMRLVLVGCVMLIGATAALALRIPVQQSVKEIVESPEMVRAVASALVEQDSQIDLMCQVRYKAKSPYSGSSAMEVLVLTCHHQPPPEPGAP